MDVFDRVAELLPRLGDFDDEAVGAALDAIDAILSEAGISWYQVAERLRSGPKPVQVPPRSNLNSVVTSGLQPRRQTSAWKQDMEDVKKAYPHRSQLDEWAKDFLESIHDQVIGMGRPLTEKQRSKLNENLDKLGL